MMTALPYNLLLALLLWCGAYATYMAFNHGLAPNARLQQLLRYLAAAVVAVIPLTITYTSPLQPTVLMALGVAALWAVTYPLTFHLTHRKSMPDYDHQIDAAFAIYLFGILSGVALVPYSHYVLGVAFFAVLLVCVFQWVYYFTCHACIDANGMKMLQETHYNEIIEFLRSYSFVRVLAVAVLVLATAWVCIVVPMRWNVVTAPLAWWQWLVVAAAVAFMLVYSFKTRHGLLGRTGLMQLYQTVKDYVAQNSRYAEQQQLRLSTLQATELHPLNGPHTLLLVIGESASRDFMSAFTDMAEDTTPWLRSLAQDDHHCTLFPHAYSCDIQTVPTLEKALTEYNQYDGGAFHTSCSIVDMARKLGYHVHWYSNQGHLGAADTPITLVAETAHVARWTKQELGKAQYDETLLDFLDEVDPGKKNLVVLHLKGSHFNYENRFTEATRQWGEPGSHDQVTNYKNTLYYTDTVLQRVFDKARRQLNLQAMVYCSDHADVPDRHRQPNFGGFRDTHIPLMVWMGDNYLTVRQSRAEALRQNSQRYWTNDLLYELVCGLLDCESQHFREDNSLASTSYRFTREDLTAMNGQVRIADDPIQRI